MVDATVAREHHTRNTLLLGTVEMGWGTGMALLQPESVLPVLLARLGADVGTISLIQPVQYAASFPCELVSPYLTEGMPRMKRWVWGLHAVTPLTWVALGAWLLERPAPGAASVLTFFALYVLWTGTLGFLIPFWYDFMGKIVDPARRGSAFSAIFCLQHVAGGVGARISHRLLHPDDPQAFPRGFAFCFLLAALAALLSNTSFLFTKEPEGGEAPPRPRLATYFGGLLGHLRHDRTLRRYLIARGVTRLAPVVATLFAIQADRKGIPGLTTGWLTGMLIAGKLVSSLLAWRFADSIGMKPFLLFGYVALAAASGLAASADAFLAPTALPWLATGFLVGVYLAADSAANASFVMNLAPEGKRATYYIAINAALFPVATLGPWLLGRLADGGVVGIPLLQGIGAGAFLLAALFLAVAVEERPARA